MEIMTPYVTIDLNKVKKNILEMNDGLKKENISHRPHIKTHKSVELAKLEIELGAKGITCATIAEVEEMAKGGIKDILLAFPIIGDKKVEVLYKILSKYPINFTTIVDSKQGVEYINKLGEKLKKKINVLLDINSGGNRGGVLLKDSVFYAKQILKRDWLSLEGLFIYYGHIYDFPQNEHKDKAKEEANILKAAEKLMKDNNIEINTLSVGSSLSSNHPEQLKGMTESRAGNFIFYDMNAVYKGVVEKERCALTVIATIISTPVPGKATIDAGSKAISTDGSLGDNNFGYILSHPEVKLVKLNEEHGFLEFDPNEINLNVGDKIEIIPNHACVIPNLHNKVFLYEDNKMDELNIDSRHRLY